EHHVEAVFVRAFDRGGSEDLEVRHAVAACVQLGQGYGAGVAIDEGDMSARPGLLGGEDAVGADAAAEVEHPVARLDRHYLAQGAGTVVESAIGEGARPGHETAGRALANSHLEGHLMPAARPA